MESSEEVVSISGCVPGACSLAKEPNVSLLKDQRHQGRWKKIVHDQNQREVADSNRLQTTLEEEEEHVTVEGIYKRLHQTSLVVVDNGLERKKTVMNKKAFKEFDLWKRFWNIDTKKTTMTPTFGLEEDRHKMEDRFVGTTFEDQQKEYKNTGTSTVEDFDHDKDIGKYKT
nr:hypothetical protein [Tanacetum cinerariifolium]